MLSSHVIAQLKLNMEKDLGLQSKASKVKECSAARTKFDEDCVQKFYDVLNSWAAIFEDHQDIEYLSSDVLATEGKQKDLLRAKVVGLEKSSTFISERIRSNNIPFYDPIKKNNLNTFSSMSAKKKAKIGDKHVLIKADREFFCRMLILQEKRGIS